MFKWEVSTGRDSASALQLAPQATYYWVSSCANVSASTGMRTIWSIVMPGLSSKFRFDFLSESVDSSCSV